MQQTQQPTRSVTWQFECCKHRRDKKGSKRFHLKSCNAGLTDPFVWPPGTVGDPLFYGDRASEASMRWRTHAIDSETLTECSIEICEGGLLTYWLGWR